MVRGCELRPVLAVKLSSGFPIRRIFAALRPIQWKHFLLLPLSALPAREIPWSPEAAGSALYGVVIAAAALAWAYGVNSIVDRRMDSPGSKNVLAGDERMVLEIWIACFACLLVALLLAAILGPIPLVAVLVSTAAGGLYSWGIRLKRFPVVGTLMNVPIFLPLLVVGVQGDLPTYIPALGFCFSLLLVSSQLLHEWDDREEDRKGGVRSTAQLLGERRLRMLLPAIGALALLVLPLFLMPAKEGLLAGGAVLLANSLAVMLPSERRRAMHRKLGLAAGFWVLLMIAGSAAGDLEVLS